MSDRFKHSESRDPFSDYIKLRLEDHPTPVDPDIWENLESGMKRKKRTSAGWFYGLLAAAALLAGLLWILPSGETEETQPVARQLAIEQEKETIHTPILPAKPLLSLATSPEKQMPATEEILPNKTEETEAIREEEQIEEVQEIEETVVNKEAGPPKPVGYHSFPKEKVVEKEKSKKRNWLVTATVGTGQNEKLDFLSAPMDFDNIPSYEGGIHHYPANNNNQLSSGYNPSLNRYTDFNYSLPISFGIMVRMSLNERWALESGLVYTYLSTRMTNYEYRALTGELNLHYIGIPLSVVANIWNHPRWNLYVSGGFTVEKGILYEFTEKGIKDNYKLTSRRAQVSGMQLSIHGALGISYRFYKHWSLYAEPRLYHYFDNNQPVSSRTDTPTGIGINAGIRYQF
ncbi:PorT family protein [Parabacteroides sp. OttesenSCG-928-K15]|nr:PorT family protein [Parabacteroides sp. OttesenSCG-928-K15]